MAQNKNISAAEKKAADEKKVEEKKIADAIALEEKEASEKLAAEKKADENLAKEKTAKYFFKSEKDIGFKKRNFYLPSTNKKYLIVAGAEIDEKTYNLFGSKAQKAFIKD